MTDALPERLITTHLEMTAPDQLRGDSPAPPNADIRLAHFADVNDYRALYQSVGEAWRWRDRLIMPDDELARALAHAEIHVLYVAGDTAGYVELAPHDDGSVEIMFFGLRSAYFGRGLGRWLLAHGVRRAWDMGARRVTVHTCNLDSPAALQNYQARGFRITTTENVPMPQRYRDAP